jgi:hypothetical protein
MLVWEIERCPALYDCLLKEYSVEDLKERLWGEVSKAVISEWRQLDGP